MVKNRRNKVLSLTNVAKKTHANKEKLVSNVREAVEKYRHIFVIKVQNMRNNKLKDLREELEGSRFFFGKNKVMAVALGTSEESEHRDGVHHIARLLHNGHALFLTDREPEEIINHFTEFEAQNFARSGFKATADFSLPAGVLEDQPFSIEPQLRKLGLSTKLEFGKVVLEKDTVVCNKGDTLTSSQAKLLVSILHDCLRFANMMIFLDRDI
jgi:mRNA turnover protein 4